MLLRAFHAACVAATALLVLAVTLLVLPDFLTASKPFTSLYCLTFIAAATRLARRVPEPRPSALALPSRALALVLLVSLGITVGAHLHAPFWVVAPTGVHCAGAGRGTPVCKSPTSMAAAGKVDDSVSIHIVGHGWHTGLILDTAALDDDVWPFAAELHKGRFLEVGWGDADFFQADEVTVLGAVDAFVTPGPSVLHVATFDEPLATFFKEGPILRVPMSRAGWRELQRFVASTFVVDAAGQPVATGHAGDYGAGSRFVHANGLYHFPNTCNVWTARALEAGGVPVTPEVALTSRNLLYQVRQVGYEVR